MSEEEKDTKDSEKKQEDEKTREYPLWLKSSMLYDVPKDKLPFLADVHADVPAWLKAEYQKSVEEVSSSDSSLDAAIEESKSSIDLLSARLYESRNNDISDGFTRVNQLLEELRIKLEDVENQKNVHSNAVSGYQKLVEENFKSVEIALMADGRIQMLEKRVDYLEDKKEKSTDRSISMWAIIVSVVIGLSGCIIGPIVGYFVSLYLGSN